MNSDNNQVMSYHRMRFMVGLLGISLPFSLIIGSELINHYGLMYNTKLLKLCGNFETVYGIKDTISDYYYTSVGELFVGTLCAVAFFMFSYRGYKNKPGEFMPSDNFMVNLAGICAMGIVIFPSTETVCLKDNFRSFVSSEMIGNIHYGFAALFFIALSIISMVNFRRNKTLEGFGQKRFDRIYLICGIGIFSSIAIIGLYKFIPFLYHNSALKNWQIPIVYFFESIALFFFGASWLIKGFETHKKTP